MVSNFKSIRYLEVDGFKKINVFIGMPNAGKSNIIEALSVSSLVSRFQFSGKISFKDFVRFSDFSNVFFEGDIVEPITIKIDDNDFLIDFKNEVLTIRAFKENKNISGQGIKFSFKEDFSDGQNINFKGLTSKVKTYHFKSDQKDFNQSFFGFLIFPYGENIGQVISSNPTLRKDVNTLLSDNNLKLLIERSTSELKIFKEYQDGTIFTLPYNLIADTLQRLIFYKAAIMSNENSVLLFEEPEAHCFEPYILEFTNSVKYDKNDNQFFIVTHSDFIIQEFLRDKESRNNTSIYLVNNVDGETKVKQLLKEKNEDVYELGMNPFFNFESLWDAN